MPNSRFTASALVWCSAWLCALPAASHRTNDLHTSSSVCAMRGWTQQPQFAWPSILHVAFKLLPAAPILWMCPTGLPSSDDRISVRLGPLALEETERLKQNAIVWLLQAMCFNGFHKEPFPGGRRKLAPQGSGRS